MVDAFTFLRRALGVVALFAAVPLIGAGAASAAKSAPTVTSTLDGRSVLPQRIHWIATPHGAEASEVEFLIDGKVRWIEHEAPFQYADDGGYLVTSFLASGLHRFAVRMHTASGSVVTRSVRARVVRAPAPPAALAGKWQRTVEQPVPADPGASAGGTVPAGTWTIDFDRRWLEATAPGKFDAVKSTTTGFGFIIDSEYVPAAQQFHVGGSVTVGVIRPEDARGGWWCETWGPPADYSWSIGGDTLTIAATGSRGSVPSARCDLQRNLDARGLVARPRQLERVGADSSRSLCGAAPR